MMKNRAKKEKAKRKTTESSMSIASKPICQEEACIGKVTFTNREEASEHSRNWEENRKHTARSSMKFGKKDACWDEECIGKT